MIKNQNSILSLESLQNMNEQASTVFNEVEERIKKNNQKSDFFKKFKDHAKPSWADSFD